MESREIFERFLEEHPDGKSKDFCFEESYPEMECIIEWYEEKVKWLKDNLINISYHKEDTYKDFNNLIVKAFEGVIK